MCVLSQHLAHSKYKLLSLYYLSSKACSSIPSSEDVGTPSGFPQPPVRMAWVRPPTPRCVQQTPCLTPLPAQGTAPGGHAGGGEYAQAGSQKGSQTAQVPWEIHGSSSLLHSISL